MSEEMVLKFNSRFTGAGAISISLVKIPVGEFFMGSEHGLPFASEGPVHQVVFRTGFSIGKFPVTQEQYVAVMSRNPAQFTEYSTSPVETVSWHDAKVFCEKLSAIMMQHVRLPSEAEWEYACRAGTATEYYFGDKADVLSDYAWFEFNSGECTHPVGLKQPNPWGLCDMVGNVWEWCEDVWHSDYSGAPQNGSAWVTNRDIQDRRSVRGAAWNMDSFRCRSSYRSYDWKDTASNRLGFRIVLATE